MLAELLVKDGILSAHPPVRQHGKGESPPDGAAVDGREDRHTQLLDGGQRGEGVDHDLRHVPDLSPALLELAEQGRVGANTEVVRQALKDHAPHGGGRLDSLHAGRKFDHHVLPLLGARPALERVESVLAVKIQHHHPVGLHHHLDPLELLRVVGRGGLVDGCRVQHHQHGTQRVIPIDPRQADLHCSQ